jgi:hypothetical protein
VVATAASNKVATATSSQVDQKSATTAASAATDIKHSPGLLSEDHDGASDCHTGVDSKQNHRDARASNGVTQECNCELSESSHQPEKQARATQPQLPTASRRR